MDRQSFGGDVAGSPSQITSTSVYSTRSPKTTSDRERAGSGSRERPRSRRLPRRRSSEGHRRRILLRREQGVHDLREDGKPETDRTTDDDDVERRERSSQASEMISWRSPPRHQRCTQPASSRSGPYTREGRRLRPSPPRTGPRQPRWLGETPQPNGPRLAPPPRRRRSWRHREQWSDERPARENSPEPPTEVPRRSRRDPRQPRTAEPTRRDPQDRHRSSSLSAPAPLCGSSDDDPSRTPLGPPRTTVRRPTLSSPTAGGVFREGTRSP